MRRKNVFVIGLSDFHRRELQTIPNADAYLFHPLFHENEVAHLEEPSILDLLERADAELAEHDFLPDAIIGHWDFPVDTMVPILCRRFDLRAPSLESVLRCDHKYWGRVSQREAIPEFTPAYQAFDPFDPDAHAAIELDYPYWVKPIKAYGSMLGFKIEGPEDFAAAAAEIRAGIGAIGSAFDKLIEFAHVPPEIRRVTGLHCIAEEFVTGLELAPEGYAQGGEVRCHGVIDMVRERNTFSRYEYPSRLPESVQRRAIQASERLIRHIGFNDGCFNAEYFWDPDTDAMRIIEVNPRISQSHSNLFEKVDGASNHAIAVSVGLGERPAFPTRQGRFAVAAKCMLRSFRDARVLRAPTDEDIRRVREEIPDTWIEVDVERCQRLSELAHQDAYSYLLAELMIGARDRDELLARYHRAVELLHIELGDPAEGCAA
jgi:biotin carboxylase